MSTDRLALDGLAERFAEAWNNRDLDGLFGAFTDDADFVDVDGMLLHGREAIAAQHGRLFQGAFARSRLRFRTAKVRMLAGNAALVYGISTMTGQAESRSSILPVRTGLWLFVVVRRGGRWRIVASQTTDIPI